MYMNNSFLSAKNRPAPSKPLLDMLESGVVNGSILDYGCGKGADVDYLTIIKPNTMIAGYDPHYQPILPRLLFDTIFCAYVINYIRDRAIVDDMISTMKRKLSDDGRLILVARSIAEVNGNVKRNSSWKYDPDSGGYTSKKSGIFQRGYDTSELIQLVTNLKMKVISDQFHIKPPSYSYVIATN